MKRKRLCVATLSPILAVCALAHYLLWPREVTHSVLLWAACAALTWLGYRCLCAQPRLRRYALVFGALFALAQVCGARLDAAESLADAGRTVGSFALLCVGTLGLAPAMGGLFLLCVQGVERIRARGRAEGVRLSPKAWGWIAFGVLLCCWLPALLAYWPGVVSYDVERQLEQVVTGVYNDHNPIAHTLLVGGFYRLGGALGSYNAGVAMYCVAQMALLAGAMAYALCYLRRVGAPGVVWWLALLLFALPPQNALLAISTTKDTFFAAAALYAATLLHQGVCDAALWRRPGWLCRWLLAALCLCLMRTNGVFWLLGLLVAALCLRRSRALRRRVLAAAAAGVVLFWGVHGALTTALNAPGGPLHELLNVPIQQLARVTQAAPNESRTEIREWLPEAYKYQPALTDYVKATVDVEARDLPAFLELWARVGVRNPVVYMDALGYLTKGYWHVDDMTHATFRGEELLYHEGYVGTIFRGGAYGVTQHSLWPALYDWYEQMYSVNTYLQVPLWSAVLGTGLWCWLLLLGFALCLYLRRRDGVLLGAGYVLMYVGLLFGPCCTVRYVYPFMLFVPLMFGLLCAPVPEQKTNA